MTGRESTMKSGILNKAWEETQVKVFSRWCAKHLKVRNIPFETLKTEFSDGVKLINLLEIIGGEKMDGKWHAKPTNRFQKLENTQLAIHYIADIKKIKLIKIHKLKMQSHNHHIIIKLNQLLTQNNESYEKQNSKQN